MLAATLLVLLAGLVHAAWNLVSKKTKAGTDFVMLYSGLSCLWFAPVAWLSARAVHMPLNARALGIVALSGLLHFGYAVALQTGYRRADLAIVYPTARGVGPLLSSVAAVLLLREKLPVAAAAGATLIVCGIVLMSARARVAIAGEQDKTLTGLCFGMTTGLFVASYTVVDAIAVRAAKLPPVLLDYLSNLTRTVILLPAIIRHRNRLGRTLERHRAACHLVALLSPVSYITVLYAMRLVPVSHIAPMREVSVLFGVLGAAVFLGEPFGWRRIAGAGAITAGVVLLTTS